mmetsp:Transcript_15924/g.39418  ORF Transcript_15924/g.39418 Transcript_15924/m.39418 type:complete len:557 (-) Transcript_15924:105-1775(-)
MGKPPMTPFCSTQTRTRPPPRRRKSYSPCTFFRDFSSEIAHGHSRAPATGREAGVRHCPPRLRLPARMEEEDGCRNGVHGCTGCLGELDRDSSLCITCLEALPTDVFNGNLDPAKEEDVVARIEAAEAMGWRIIEDELPRGDTTDHSPELKAFLLNEVDPSATDVSTRFGLLGEVEEHPRGSDKDVGQARPNKGRLFANTYELAVFGAYCAYVHKAHALPRKQEDLLPYLDAAWSKLQVAAAEEGFMLRFGDPADLMEKTNLFSSGDLPAKAIEKLRKKAASYAKEGQEGEPIDAEAEGDDEEEIALAEDEEGEKENGQGKSGPPRKKKAKAAGRGKEAGRKQLAAGKARYRKVMVEMDAYLLKELNKNTGKTDSSTPGATVKSKAQERKEEIEERAQRFKENAEKQAKEKEELKARSKKQHDMAVEAHSDTKLFREKLTQTMQQTSKALVEIKDSLAGARQLTPEMAAKLPPLNEWLASSDMSELSSSEWELTDLLQSAVESSAAEFDVLIADSDLAGTPGPKRRKLQRLLKSAHASAIAQPGPEAQPPPHTPAA